MTMARSLCVLVGLLVAGCQPTTDAGQQPDDVSMKPPPAEFAGQVQRAELLGRTMYQKDILAAKATDALLASVRGARVGGWVTAPDGDKWVVYFFDQSPRNPAIIHEVNFPDSSGSGPKVGKPGSRPALEKTAAAMFRARGAALKAKFLQCSRTYNSVVVPADLAGEKGWYVYLLAATTKSGVAVMGGHARVHVSTDGKKIHNVKAFSRSCINVPIDRKAAGLMVSHIVGPHPVETHVFMSLLYRTPIYVGISPHVWAVEEGLIRLVEG